MKYSAEQITEIKKNVFLPGLVASRGHKIESRGKEYWTICPFHKEDTPSFSMFKDPSGVWLFQCFGCNAQGNVFQFVQDLEKISFGAAVDKVIQESDWQAGTERVNKVFSPVIDEKVENVVFPLSAMAQAEKALEESTEAKKWLENRGISLETARNFHLGYKQDASIVAPKHLWVTGGWILFPTVRGNKITCLKYRSIQGKKTPDGQPGFLRAPNMETTAYNLDSVIPFDDVYVVEGEPDTMIMQQNGFICVGLPGAQYSLKPWEREILMSATRVFIAGDNDETGKAAAAKLWRELEPARNQKGIPKRVFVLEWEGAKDANEKYLLTKEKFRDTVERMKQISLGRPLPGFYNIIQSIRTANVTKPLENPARLRFPWKDIDPWMAILPSDLMVVFASESGMGKTDWIKDILLYNTMKYGKVVANYSAEVSPSAYARRVTANLTGHDRNKLEPADFKDAARILEDSDAQFYNGYEPGATFKDLLQWVDTPKGKVAQGLLVDAKQHLGADIVVIDHLHFLIRGERDETLAQASAMRALKDFAIAFGVIMIIVCQPRKGMSGARGRVANMQDAKGSETLGSDASAVFILHRDRISDDAEGSPVFSPITLVKLDKAREADSAKTKLFFRGSVSRFTEITPQQNLNLGEINDQET